MKKLKIGMKSICSMCGKEIEWVGPYWRHTTYSPRHSGTPIGKNESKEQHKKPEKQHA